MRLNPLGEGAEFFEVNAGIFILWCLLGLERRISSHKYRLGEMGFCLDYLNEFDLCFCLESTDYLFLLLFAGEWTNRPADMAFGMSISHAGFDIV